MNIKLLHSSRRQHGFSLIELMVAMAVGTILTSGTISLFANMVGSNSNMIKTTRLQQELRTIMNIMANDIRRAGSWGDAITATQGIANPFTVGTGIDTTDLLLLTGDTTIVTNGTGECVLYTYEYNPWEAGNLWDQDTNGSAVDANEYFGFHWDSTSKELYMRSDGTTTDDCTDGTWEAVNNNNTIEITLLNFANTNYTCANVSNQASTCAAAIVGDTTQTIRSIDITLTGQLAGDPASARTLTETIRVRNDQIVNL